MSHGDFVWYELSTNDLAGAIKFYGGVVGWDNQKFEGTGGPPYWIWTAGGKGIGGLMALTDESKKVNAGPNWVGYVQVDDVDAMIRKRWRSAPRPACRRTTFRPSAASPCSPTRKAPSSR